MPGRLLFVRHAESRLSARGLVNGDPSVDCPLTEEGRRQARALRARLARDPIDVCITTAFRRTQETAEIALTGVGVPVLLEAGLNDPPLGTFESRPLDEYVEWLAQHDWATAPPGGGESQLGSVRRFVDAFARVLELPQDRVLLVTHAFPIGVARTLAYDPPPAVRPHYECGFDYVRPVEIAPAALAEGVARARRELSRIDGA